MHDFILLFLVYAWVLFFDECMQIFDHFDKALYFQWAWNKVATVPPNLPRPWQKRRNETKKTELTTGRLWWICNACLFTFPRLCGCGCSSSILKGWFLVQKRSSIIISSIGVSLIFIVLDQISCFVSEIWVRIHCSMLFKGWEIFHKACLVSSSSSHQIFIWTLVSFYLQFLHGWVVFFI